MNTDSDTPVMDSDTPSLYSVTLKLGADHEALLSDKVRYKSECVIGKSDRTVDSHYVMENADAVTE